MRRTAGLMWVVVAAISFSSLAAQEAGEGKSEKSVDKAKQKADEAWQVLFNGKDLKGWEPAKGFDYGEKANVSVEDGCLMLGTGNPAAGVRWTGQFPKTNYELRLEGKRAEGSDFFCGLTFPAGEGGATLILGGWGGWVVGLSCINGELAADNESCSVVEFKNDRWYRVRLRVTDERIQVWVDDERIVNVEREGRRFTVDSRMEPCMPLGIATWITKGALRDIRYRTLSNEELAGEKK